MMEQKQHWEHVYSVNEPAQVSWFEPESKVSLELIRKFLPSANSNILDVGAGASTLVDGLLEAGYKHVRVMDLSGAALKQAQSRLGHAGNSVKWIEADVLEARLPAHGIDLWHDRTLFHFLTSPDDRRRYVDQVRTTVRPGGVVLVATFADDGPSRWSDLDVDRYTASTFHDEFGAEFRIVETRQEVHHTPWGAAQAFTYCLCRYEPFPSVHQR
jgi:SAM-dependent methyltransferase